MDEIKNNRRCRKYQLTFNNPEEHGLDHDKIKKSLCTWPNVIYYCLADEQASTYHTHMFLLFENPIRFSSIKKIFPTAHIEEAKGTAEENRAYIRKEGKWKNSEKETTSLPETFEEWGTMPQGGQGRRTDLANLYSMIKDGYSNVEILEHNSDHILSLQHIDKARLEIQSEKYRCQRRDNLQVCYVYGKTGTGKTRGIFESHGYENVYRVTDYVHPFDNYKGEEVICFEEYRSDFPIGSMLNYLDIYPLQLPARYNNKQACYTYVYIVSNIPLTAQYSNIQKEQPETWLAFLRRIHKVKVYDKEGHFVEFKTQDYLNGFHPAVGTDVPFKEDAKDPA